MLLCIGALAFPSMRIGRLVGAATVMRPLCGAPGIGTRLSYYGGAMIAGHPVPLSILSLAAIVTAFGLLPSGWAIITTVAIACLYVLLLRSVVLAHARSVAAGPELLVGVEGVVRRSLDPDGQVLVAGSLWRARAPGPLTIGTRVRVVGRQGLTLMVDEVIEGRKEH